MCGDVDRAVLLPGPHCISSESPSYLAFTDAVYECCLTSSLNLICYFYLSGCVRRSAEREPPLGMEKLTELTIDSFPQRAPTPDRAK